MRSTVQCLLSLAFMLGMARAITFDPSNKTQVLEGSNLVIQGMLDYCPYAHNVSGSTPGMFQAPYYWWEGGVAWNALLDWATVSQNDTYNDLIRESLEFQSGEFWNYMTFNQTSVEGNDDQGFWGVAVMAAAEKNFTRPTKGYPDWLYFAQATFNTMASRWDSQHCGGGLRWQIYTWNAGYDYKNMVSNGCLFNLASRLARFTNNDTYVEWAERIWDWAWSVQFLFPANPNTTDWTQKYIKVFDGAHIGTNCTDIPPWEWTYDQGLMLSGTAFMYNHTEDQKWLDRFQGLWSRAEGFFGGDLFNDPKKVLYEASCMRPDNSLVTCTTDQRCFKGIFLRLAALAMRLIPSEYDTMWDYLLRTAQAASWSCTGGTDGHTCGLNWLNGGWDGKYGLGEQICALDAFNSILIYDYPPPYRAKDLPEIYGSGSPASTSGSTNSTNGTNAGPVYGNGNAGLNSTTTSAQVLSLGTSDYAGAGVLTAVVLLILIGSSIWLLL